ncbi:hypothetical protein SAMN02745181_0999 [Rubritalea squalenifaciens DSM 18772]|uniref:Uncharacterized protein n=1 Tax=Rubritalea squalenifaciens DSM 18772 TaxID=1123071 RepID=A0A1M6ECT2_9BACT|nr:hypothetical protein [Rubritalea squalenifaciens]SHI83292.1 hypothetical protein SAMN02745181_0999 [Rubritalea squalenifaciens DSM 18772]
MKTLIFSLATLASISLSPAEELQTLLEQGNFAQATSTYGSAKTNQARFTKSICTLAGALEKVAQENYRFGLINQPDLDAGLGLSLPIPENPDAESIDYKKFRTIISDFHESLHEIEAHLAEEDGTEFNLPLDLTRIRIDVNKDGKYVPSESLISFFMQWQGEELEDGNELPNGLVHFDRGDLLWLRGYTQIMLATTDFILAHDFSSPFDVYARNFYSNYKSSLPHLPNKGSIEPSIADAISFFHQLSLTVTEPERLKSSRQHFLNMAKNSREMWKAILAETDDQREWLPSPKQKSVIGVPITEEMVKGWDDFLNEWEAILEGKKLIPHWRFPGKGINLKRAFDESKHTDLILWLTGEAAAPYIEEGEVTQGDFWRQLNETFGQNFLPMSFWIN